MAEHVEKPQLRVVDPETGELHETCPGCRRLSDEMAGLEEVIRGQGAKLRELRRNKAAEAMKNPLWAEGEELFDYWRRRCRHPKSKFDHERFSLCEPFLRQHGLDLCKRAIDGAAYYPFTTRRKNGSLKRHDDWELIHRDAGKWESFVNRAPKEV